VICDDTVGEAGIIDRRREPGVTVMWWQILLSLAAGLGLLYLTLLALLWRAYRHNPDTARLREGLRLLPDVLRLLRRLAADQNLPRGVRGRLILLIAYLASPIDLIPDFIPVLGYADDAVIVAIALRSVARRAGPQAIASHWPGTPEGLRLLQQLTGLPTTPLTRPQWPGPTRFDWR
jgi:uncharacterized membrane protein YkvA (DUF1232 family)